MDAKPNRRKPTKDPLQTKTRHKRRPQTRWNVVLRKETRRRIRRRALARTRRRNRLPAQIQVRPASRVRRGEEKTLLLRVAVDEIPVVLSVCEVSRGLVDLGVVQVGWVLGGGGIFVVSVLCRFIVPVFLGFPSER